MDIIKSGDLKKIDRRIVGVLLLAYGLICAFVLVYSKKDLVGNGWIDFRSDKLTDRYNTLLTEGKFIFSDVSHTLGYPLYFPYIMKLFDIRDGFRMFCLAQTLGGMCVVLLYPLLTHKITNSFIAALASPFVIHFTFGDVLYINKCNEFWGGLWSAIITIPLLYLYRRETDSKKKIFLISGIAMVISCSNVLRNANGLPALIIALLILLEEIIRKKVTWKSILISIVVLLCTFNLLSTAIPCYVAEKWGVPGKEGYNSSPWHSILIGMGYIENEYGLFYDDNCGRELIGRLYPDVEYASTEYEECCKKVVLQILAEDPMFVIKGLFAKLEACLKLQIKYLLGRSSLNIYSYWWIFIGIAIEVLLLIKIKKIKEYVKKYVTLFVIGGGVTFLSIYAGVLAYPSGYYILGTIGGTGLIVAFFFLTMGAVIIQYGKDKLVNQKIDMVK